jgi:hypothetical protein
VKYAAPKLTRYGTVAALTASDLKCSIGDDNFGLSERRGVWYARDDGSNLWDQYSNQTALGNTVGAQGFADLLTTGGCRAVQLGVHPVTGK